MKNIFNLFILLFTSTLSFSQTADSVLLQLKNGSEAKCIVVFADEKGIEILTDKGKVLQVAAELISTIDGISYPEFLNQFKVLSAQNKIQNSKSFQFQLEKGGLLIAAGTGLTLGAIALSTFASLSDEKETIWFVTAGAISITGTLMVMIGGANIAKAGRTFKEKSFGQKENFSLQYGLLGNGAGVRLRL
jgi:hypothetical protein